MRKKYVLMIQEVLLMTVSVKRLRGEDRRRLIGLLGGPFVHGQCYELAIALCRGTGYPIVGLMNEDTIWHTGVRLPCGRLHDGRGPVAEEHFGLPFGMVQPYQFKDLVEVDLFAVRPVSESRISIAMRIAQAIWPDLPWKTDTLELRVRAYMEELAVLSAKHGLWVTPTSPGGRPVLSQDPGMTPGYTIYQTIDGLGFCMDRTSLVSEAQYDAIRELDEDDD